MRRVIVSARIFSDEGKPASGHIVMVDAFSIEAQRFRVFSEGKADQNGFVQMSFDGSKIEGSMAPALRLIEAGSPTTRVLSGGGFMRHDRRSDTLFVDFGEIERLEETAFRRSAAGGGFTSQIYQVAGVIKRPEGSQLALERNLAAQPELRASLASSSRPAGTFVVVNNSDETAARGDDDVIAAAARLTTPTVVASREVDTLKAINLEKDATISNRDRELILKNAEISTKTTEINTLSTRLTSTESELAKEKDRADKAAARVAELEGKQGVEADVQSVVTGLGTKLSAANADLKVQALPFRIGMVKVDLRGKLTPDGGKIVLGGEDAQVGSGVSTELHVDKGAGAADQTTVPSVIGLTESAARRVLRSVGLRIKSARQTLAPEAGTPGQAITQHPIAGASTEHGTEILVVFGVASVSQ
ncbi:MAG: PASTA domain-containing protein [Pseudomonadota bacterium]